MNSQVNVIEFYKNEEKENMSLWYSVGVATIGPFTTTERRKMSDNRKQNDNARMTHDIEFETIFSRLIKVIYCLCEVIVSLY